jgi:GDP-4-dehydro-6-deoxy-D-mannose reductase
MPETHPPTALITGCNGFVGSWLGDHLRENGYVVHGIDLRDTGSASLVYHPIDMLDCSALTALVAQLRPATIYHLAGMSFLPDADRSPRSAIDANVFGAIALLDAVKDASPASRLLMVGSAKEYSDSVLSDGIAESHPPQPTNFYGISKYAAELIGLQYFRQYGLDVRCTRSFNHTGPGQSPRFVCSDWARQTAAIALGTADPAISVGDLNATIDFCDVRDVVAAYRLILDKGEPGEVYNVCSGDGVDLSWILDYLGAKSPRPITVLYADGKRRLHRSNLKMIGSRAKLTTRTGWCPQIPLPRTLDDMYAWWLRELQDG